MILVNFSNQIAAGPKNISLNFIRQAIQNGLANNAIFLVPYDEDYLKVLADNSIRHFAFPISGSAIITGIKTIYVHFLLIPWLTHTQRVEGILAFGNFLLGGKASKKVVLLHHPYIVDDKLFGKLNFKGRFLEHIKRKLFGFTVKRVDKVIVQSSYMEHAFKRKYPEFESRVEVIGNPVSDNILASRLGELIDRSERVGSAEKYRIIYASRYYPHKNHEFIVELASAIKIACYPVEIYVTVDERIHGAKLFLEKVKEEALPVVNIGEVPQSELAEYYKKSDALFFPSKSETFGNPLIEALFFSLPIIVPEKEYARAIVGDGGIYYIEGNISDCLEKIQRLFSSKEEYKLASMSSLKRSREYSDAKTWFQQVSRLIGDNNGV